ERRDVIRDDTLRGAASGSLLLRQSAPEEPVVVLFRSGRFDELARELVDPPGEEVLKSVAEERSITIDWKSVTSEDLVELPVKLAFHLRQVAFRRIVADPLVR